MYYRAKKYQVTLNDLVLVLVVLIIFSGVVYGAQPALPTSVYGKVLSETGEPAAGIEAIVLWADSNGNSHTEKTKTLSKEAAAMRGDSSLFGYYFFNTGTVSAEINTKIIVKINGYTYQEITANPGGIIKIPDAMLKLQPTPASGTVSGFGKGSSQRNSGISGTGGLGSGQGNQIGSKAASQETASGGSGGLSEQTGAGSDGQSNAISSDAQPQETSSSSATGSGLGAGDGEQGTGEEQFFGIPDAQTPPVSPYVPLTADNKSSSEYSKITPNPLLPTNIYGKLVDTNGRPVEQEIVTAQWTDQFGVNHSATTKTLTTQEALALGNKELAGYYLFTEGDITAPSNGTITIKTQPRQITSQISPNPGKSVEVKPIVLYGPKPPPRIERVISNQILNSTGKIFSEFKERNRLVAVPFFVALALGGIFVILRKYYQRRKKKPKRYYQLYHDLKVFGSHKIASIMAGENVSVSPEKKITEAVELMVSKDTASLAVVSKNRPVGILSDTEFLQRVFTQENSKSITVGSVMAKSNFALDAGDTISHAMKTMAQKKLKFVMITSHKSFAGTIGCAEILAEIYDFFSKNNIDPASVPRVELYMEKDVAKVAPEATLSDVIRYMNFTQKPYAALESAEEIVRERCFIVTFNDILGEFFKNPDMLLKIKIKQMLPAPLPVITPGTSILEALEVMHQNKCKCIGVISEGAIAGVLPEDNLLYALDGFMRDVIKVIEQAN